MFDYNGMIQRAVKFFPTWSDIRKRYTTSSGGKLLSSVTEEVMELEKAINEYKKYYFLDTYEGHEDDIMAYAYKYAIGHIDIKRIKIVYNNEEFLVTDDITKLLINSKVAYFEDGCIYVDTNLHPEDLMIYVDADHIKTDYVKTHVWNIFDEFACFVGLERHKDESNSDLVKRITHINMYKPNSTIEGLQNAIMAELLTEFPDISRDEIEIERTDETNLRKPYKDFNTLLDFLNSINCDVYRWKRWDINTWQHDFKSINYIPAVWDESVTNFTNGIGYGKDCEVSIANNIKETNAVITLYDKNKETMNKYLADKNIEKNISFKLKRYNDVLEHNTINYTIKASQLTQLDPESITLDIHQEINVVEDIPLENIYAHGHNIEVNNSNSTINDIYPYRLKFEVKDNGKEIDIAKCKVLYINKITGELLFEENLLKEKTGFMVNSLGHLVSNSIKRSITKVEDFNHDQVSFFENMPNNAGIKAVGSVSTGIKTLYNLGGQQISYSASCEMSDIYSSTGFIEFDSSDCGWIDNGKNIVFNSVNKFKKVNIKLTANKFAFDVLTNNTIDVMYRFGTEGVYEISKAKMGETWSTKEFESPRYMEIVITTKAEEEIKIGNFKYSNYDINFYYKIKDTFVKMPSPILPASNEITFKVEVTSKSGHQPIIKGIYIGSGLSATTYITNSFQPVQNCYREIVIDSNCEVTLIKRDVLDTSDRLYIKNYDPSVSYKAIENDSYIRLNLNDYNEIFSIKADVGQIQKVEESGQVFYNLSLTYGEEAKRITVSGTKNETVNSISLLDIINTSMKNYTLNITNDKVYCSSLVQGVVVIKNDKGGEAEIVPIKSTLFNGIDSTKYIFTNIPDDIGVIWGVGDGHYGDFITGSFDYISFYKEGNEEPHVANNSYNLFVNEIKDIPIAENFTNPTKYNKNNLNFYTVECNTENMDVRFYNYLDEKKSFDDLKHWSVGIKNLYLKNTCDYNNNTSYEVSVLDYSSKEVLSEYIDIKDTYQISKNNTIITEQYIIEPPEGMSVRYKTYDGTSETKDLIKTEIVVVDKTMFKKLQFSNIDKIISINTTGFEEASKDIDFNLLNEEGIIIWNTPLEEGTNVYLKYIIKKPVALVFDLDLLYKLTGYTVDTYRELNSYYLSNMKDGSTYDLNNFSDFKDSDLAYIQCSEPSFEGQMINEYTVRFNKHIEEKTVLVKTGYYYFNGREYYLFSEDESKMLNNNKHMMYENVDISDDYIYTYKATNNFVRNSEMLLRNINDMYNYDFSTPNPSPMFNKYTACDSYNDWITFNTTLGLTDELYKKRLATNEQIYEGFNDTGLKLTKKEASTLNYAYLDITEFVKPVTFITLAATEGLKIYIGEEQDALGLKSKSALSIGLHKEIVAVSKESSIRTTNFTTKENTKYYLIVCGEGILDDIIISDKLDSISNYHVKNIEKFGLFFNEVKNQGTVCKLNLDNLHKNINHKASMCSDGYIRIVGGISWNSTKIKVYDTFDDFDNRNCFKDSQLLISDYLKAPETSSGRFMTDYIQIDPKIVNRLFIKVNDVLLDNMNNFKITVLGTDNLKTSFSEIFSINSHCAFIYNYDLCKYIKFNIEIPEGGLIDKIEIFAEYKSNKDNAPALMIPDSGYILSPVFDSQQSSIYDIKNINIEDISNINDVDIYIRSMTENNESNVWGDWNKLELKEVNGKVVYDRVNSLSFKYTPVRYFQFRIVLKHKDAYVKFNSLDIEVKE